LRLFPSQASSLIAALVGAVGDTLSHARDLRSDKQFRGHGPLLRGWRFELCPDVAFLFVPSAR